MVKMEATCVDEDKRRKHLTKVILGVVLFIGIFSFVYWFVGFPIVWSNMPSAQWISFWFNLYCLIAFLIWLVIVFLALLLLWYYKDKVVPVAAQKASYYSVSPTNNESAKGSGLNNSPPYVTELIRVQPGDKDISIQAQELLIKLENKSSDPIVMTDASQNSSEAIDSSNKSQHLQTETDDGPKCNKHISENVQDGHEDSVNENNNVIPVNSEENASIILRKKQNLTVDTSRKAPDAYDDKEASPKSPREIFFADLIKQTAEHNKKSEQTMTAPERFSYCLDEPTKVPHNIKSRKSVPLYFYISPYGTELCDASEKTVENNPPVNTAVKQPTETAVKHPTETAVKHPTETAVKHPIEIAVKHPTERAVKHPTERAVKHPTEIAETSVKIVAENLKENSKVKERNDDNATRMSLSEYFIANIEGPQSVTSEAHIFVSGNDENDLEPCNWMFGKDSGNTQDGVMEPLFEKKEQERDISFNDDSVFY